MSDKAISTLLTLKPGGSLLPVNAPAGYPDMVAPLPNGAKIVHDFDADPDVIHVFVTDEDGLTSVLAPAIQKARPEAAFWVSYPKKDSTGTGTGMTRQIVHDAFRRYGYKPVSQFSVDATWSAIRGRPT